MELVFGVLGPSLPGLREGSLYWVQRMCSFYFKVLILGWLLSVGFVDCFGWVRWSSGIGGVRVFQIHWAMESVKVMSALMMNKSVLQGQFIKVNGSLR